MNHSYNRSLAGASQLPILALGLILLATGCATMHEPLPPEAQPPENYAQHKEIGNLTIGVQPMTQKPEIEKFFNVNLLESGIVPIWLVAENRDPSASFIIAKENVFVLNDATGETNTLGNKQMATGKVVAGAVITVIGAGGLLEFVGLKLTSDASVIQHNFYDKEYYSTTLDPGGKTQGFIYLQLPKSAPPSGLYRLEAKVKNTSTDEVTPFDFELNLNATTR